ncbi:MAG: hypothetical protein P8Y72_12575 [Anaerolineales bacterium]
MMILTGWSSGAGANPACIETTKLQHPKGQVSPTVSVIAMERSD